MQDETVHTEPELPMYRAVARATDYESGTIEVSITRGAVEIRSLIVTGRSGLNEVHVESVGYAPDEDARSLVPMELLLATILGGLLFYEANARGDITQ